MSALVAILAKAVQVTQLLMIEKLKSISAGSNYDALEFKSIFNALIVPCLNLREVGLVLAVNRDRRRISSQS